MRTMRLALVVLFTCGATGSFAQRRLNPISEWATAGDLTPRLLRNGDHEESTAEYDISENGSIQNCRAQSVSRRLADLTCRLIAERARYAPAHDSAGNPVRSRDMMTILWDRPRSFVGLTDYGGARPDVPIESWIGLPDMNRRPMKRSIALVRFEINATGSVGRCVILAGSGDERIPVELCKALHSRAKFRPPVDERGAPYAVVASLRLDVPGETEVPKYRINTVNR